MRRTRSSLVLSLLLTGALFAGACGSDDNKTSDTKTKDTSAAANATDNGDETSADATGTDGGTLVLGAEQEPDCVDWVSSCAGSSWGFWMIGTQTMPRAFDMVEEGGTWVYTPSAVLSGEPKLEEVAGKQTVTYTISDDAVWDDGEPITSSDFKYTWDQVANGTDIYDQTGYKDIEGVDDSDPKTAVVTFANKYASWKGLFGGGYGLYPSHLLEGKDRNAEMKDGYTFSGGPFKLEKWDKGVEVTLVRNDNYFGTKAKLDKVVFKIIPDTAAEFQAFKAGEVQGIYPQPQIATIDAIKAGGLEGTQTVNAKTGSVEALWLNNAKAPFDDVNFRQAIAYAVDRDAIVKALFGGIGVDKAVQSFNPPILSAYAGDDFSVYQPDPAKVDEHMTAAGYAKGADGIWAKGDQKASFVFRTTAGNARRELTAQVLQQQLKDAGFDMTIETAKAGDLFGQMLPAGDFQMALYAQVATTLDPGLCVIMCSENIPSDANGNAGQNFTRTNVPAADPLLKQVDVETDDAARQAASKSADKALADSATSLPLDPLPNIALLSDKIVGPTDDHPVLSVFVHLAEWSLAE